MASVKTLGPHRPTGLQHAVDEELLDEDADPSRYTWEIMPPVGTLTSSAADLTADDGGDELLVTGSGVLWSRGGVFQRAFRFEVENEEVRHALMAHFPASEGGGGGARVGSTIGGGGGGGGRPADDGRRRGGRGAGGGGPAEESAGRLAKALVVFLKTQAHVFFLSGASHVIHLPFEVDAVVAAPRGVVIQRKLKAEAAAGGRGGGAGLGGGGIAAVELRLPRVPPNSFVSNHMSPIRSATNYSATDGNNNNNVPFSTDGLGNKPRALPLRLSSTLENMWEQSPPVLTPYPDAHWPRLVCLTDPLHDFGLVVSHALPSADEAERQKRRVSFGPAPRTHFLDPGEEVVHIEAVDLPGGGANAPLVLAVTVNRQAAAYTVWRLTYLPKTDVFTGGGGGGGGGASREGDFKRRESARVPSTTASRRRSSMQPGGPGLDAGARDSFAAGPAPPSKRGGGNNSGGSSRRPEHRTSSTAADSLAATLDAADREESIAGGSVARRVSRRISGALVRADLSVNQERALLADQAGAPGGVSFHGGGGGGGAGAAGPTGSRRVESHGSQRGGTRTRTSTGGGVGVGGGGAGNLLGSLRESTAASTLLDELRSAGDFADAHSFSGMGLGAGHSPTPDDADFAVLAKEMLLTRIHSVPVDAANVRYSLSGQPAGKQAKVFVLAAPPFATDAQGRTPVLVGIQDPADKRLQLLTLYATPPGTKGAGAAGVGATAGGKGNAKSTSDWTVSWGHLVKAQSVLDSCKLTDGSVSAILLLSRSSTASGYELSLQAPWSQLTLIQLPAYFPPSNLRSLDFAGTRVARARKERESLEAALPPGGRRLVGLRHAAARGVVDVLDDEGALKMVRVQLEPRNPVVRSALDGARAALRAGAGERLLAGWWHVMQWATGEGGKVGGGGVGVGGGMAGQVADLEFSALVVELFVIFLALGLPENYNFQDAVDLRARQHRGRAESDAEDYQPQLEAWDAMAVFETATSLAAPAWMQGRAWEWTLSSEETRHGVTSTPTRNRSLDFLARHMAFAKQYALSDGGITALSPTTGYLPTSLGRSKESRRGAARDLFMALHLVLEEAKLDVTAAEQHGYADLRLVLAQVARWLKWYTFANMYELSLVEELDSALDDELVLSYPIPEPPAYPCILTWLQERLTTSSGASFLTLADIYFSGVQTVESAHHFSDRRWDIITPKTLTFVRLFHLLGPTWTPVALLEALYRCRITPTFLDSLPPAVLVPIQDAICLCQPSPPTRWPRDLLALVGRDDMTLVREPGRRRQMHMESGGGVKPTTHVATWDYKLLCQSVDEFNNVGFDEGDGTERQAVVRALFRTDRRLNEAQNLLSSHKPRVVRLDARPDWTESAYLERQKDLVTRMATSTLAISAGRGMLYYALRFPLLTQKFHIGGFNLNCVVRPTNVTVGVDKSLFTEEKVCWAFFHQGVAAGLAISPQAKGIDTSWILYNKPAQDLSNRHAGFLLALGLNGHLKSVAKWVAFKYLTPKHTMTSMGLLLGLAASYLGTMDGLITRLLSVHVTRMLPRGAADLNLSPLTQTTGVMGIGLVYAASRHRRMSDIMASELEHVESDDDEEPLRSECYRLAAGFALGLINLGSRRRAGVGGLGAAGAAGNNADMRLTERLLTLAAGIHKVELVHVLDRSAAAATVAIALIYMKSEDAVVARKVDVPESVLQFDYVRPDVLLLRTLAKNLILWAGIEPTFKWIRRNLPRPYRRRYKQLIPQGVDPASGSSAPRDPSKLPPWDPRFKAAQPGKHKLHPHHHHSHQRVPPRPALTSADLPFFSILAGLCFSIGLRYAGSADLRARDLLVHYLDQFMAIAKLATPSSPARGDGEEGPDDEAERQEGAVPGHDARIAAGCARTCLDVLALSTASVMAGTGDLVVLRRLRALHGRDDRPREGGVGGGMTAAAAGDDPAAATTGATTYGSHMAAHLAIGALFLGCGTATFATSDLAVASLLIAFYPVFPSSVMDNQAHLQAFRHFWVLATDPRCLVTKEVASGAPVSVPVNITLKGGKETDARGTTKNDDAKGKGVEGRSTDDRAEPAPPQPPFQLRLTTPCLLPPLDAIQSLRTDAGPAFWDLSVDLSQRRLPGGANTADASGSSNSSAPAQTPHHYPDPDAQPPLDAFRSPLSSALLSVYLRRRPAQERPFASALRALAGRGYDDDDDEADGKQKNHGGAQQGHAQQPPPDHPLDWLFAASPALCALTHSERALVLGEEGGGGGGDDHATRGAGAWNGSSAAAAAGGGGAPASNSGTVAAGAATEASSTAVDARLALEAGLAGRKDAGSGGVGGGLEDAEGWEGGGGPAVGEAAPQPTRDHLLSLRLLFAWAEKRRAWQGLNHHLGGGAPHTAAHHAAESGPPPAEDGQASPDDAGAAWWLRDAVVEKLKAQVWLAGRGEGGAY